MTTWHLYGILGQKPDGMNLEGLHGAPVQLLGGPNTWALVSEVQAIPTNALDPIMHHKVIETVLEHWDVLPARFMAPLEHRVLLNRLEAKSQQHLLALSRIRGSLEFSIRAQIDAGSMKNPDGHDPSGHQSLEHLAQTLERNLPALEWLHHFPEPGVYRGNVLVAKATLLNFRLAFMRFEGSPAASLHGPFPAYSFSGLGVLS